MDLEVDLSVYGTSVDGNKTLVFTARSFLPTANQAAVRYAQRGAA